jgi:subtilase family serine protease
VSKRYCTQLFATALGLLLPATLLAQQQPGAGDRVLPNFDSRLTIPRQAAARLDTQAAVEQLRGESGPDAQTRLGADGSVRTLAAHGRPLTPRALEAPEDVARRFLARHARAFGLDPADLAGLTAGAASSRGASGLVAVDLRQFVQGIRVFGADVRVYLTPAGEIVRVTSSAARGGAAAPAVTLTPEQAARIAAADIRPELEAPSRVLRGSDGLDRRTMLHRGGFAADVEAALVWFPAQGSLHLAWQVLVEPPGFAQKYDVLIDAATGELLYRRNRVLYTQGSGRVLQSDTTRARDARLADEHPAGATASGPGDAPNGCPPLTNHITRSLTTPFRDPSTVLFGTGRLEGNNAHVFRGADGVDAVSGTTQADGSRLFDFPFGSAGSAETHLFFAVNFLHDFFYDLGFDEASGNFQQDNLGRGGAGGDSLHALARADGRNNASFEPRPEGESPIMSMFLFDGEGCWSSDVDDDGLADLDGDFDSDIVIHEFHHGVSWRLNPEFTGVEADAMGEGGGDFFAYSINGDTRLAEYAVPGVGIREVNGRTYGSWWCWYGLLCEPHDNGEIWADVLWDLRERFRADLVDGSEATAVRHAHVVYLEGLRLSPPSPTMLDMRDAMLQADALLRPSGGAGGSANYCRIWEVFALRGLGSAALDTNDTGDLTVVENSSMPAACPALPAAATVTITATDSAAAEVGLDTGTFTVTRSGDTTRALTVYLAAPAGSAVPGADYVPLPPTITIAEGASSATLTVTPIDDAIVESNETVSLSLTDGPGYQVGSPGGAAVTLTSDDVAPDLAVTALTGPAAAGAGLAIAVNETTKNQGTGEATASVTRYYLSANTTVDVADTVLGSRSVPLLAVGASSAATVTLTIPAGTATGTYYVIAMADADAAMAEIVESNNQRSFVTRIGPDFQILGVTAPSTTAAGAAIVVGETTKNKGGGDAGASTTSFFLSTNPTYDATDAALGSRGVPALAAGASHAAQTTVTIPSGTPGGTYYLIALADAANAVAETTETDNASQATVRVGPDLTVSALAVPAIAGAGVTVMVADTTKNAGGGPSVESVTRFLLSTNSTLDGADVTLAERAVAALAGNGADAATTPVTIPPGTVAGVYYLLAQADAAAGNAEVIETNNLRAVQVRVGPDLVVLSLGAPGAVAAGAGMTVTDTAKNQGGAVASASSVGLYWSSNTTLDASDAALGSRSVPALEAGTGSSGSTQVVVPAGAAPGTYYVIARADRDADVIESNEANNTAYVVIHVGPDLQIAQATLSATSVAAGGNVVLTDTTQNSGGAAAPASTSRAYLSINSTLDAADTALGSRPLAGLAAGAGHAGTIGITIPPGTAPGRWYIIVKADADGVVAESFETNNTRSVTITVN